MKSIWFLSAFILLAAPSIVFGADIPTDLVPCGDTLDGVEQSDCQACHVYALVENVFQWIFGVATVIVSIIIVTGGVRMATSAGNQQAKRDARKLIGAAVVGFILIGSAWMLIDLLIATLAGVPEADSILVSIECVAQPGE